MQPHLKKLQGFTLIEVSLVIIVMGLLMAGLAPLLLRQHSGTMEARNNTALEDAKTAIINYAISYGGIPDPVENATGCSTTLITTPGIMPPQAGCVGAVSAFGVNNWGAFGSESPFRLDVNDALKSRYVTAIASSLDGLTGVSNATGGDRVVFCQAVQQQMSPPATAGYCSFSANPVDPVHLTSAGCTAAVRTWTTASCSNGVLGAKAACETASGTWGQQPQLCSDMSFNHLDAASRCTLTTINTLANPNSQPSQAAFVLISRGPDRISNQENALASTPANSAGVPIIRRVYENGSRGINNSSGNDHYDDQVKSYPLSGFARDCREKMGVSAEVMSCAPGQKWVGSLTNTNSTYINGASYSLTKTVNATTGVIETLTGTTSSNGFTTYLNTCVQVAGEMSITMFSYGSSPVIPSLQLTLIAMGAGDGNRDGRVDFVITATPTLTAQ